MRIGSRVEALERRAPPAPVLPPGPIFRDPAQIEALERLRLYLSSLPIPYPDPLPIPDHLVPVLRMMGVLAEAGA